MTRLWSSLALPRYQQATVETAIDQVKKDLLQVIENGREVASCLDAIGVSTTISHLVGAFRRVWTLQRSIDKCEKDLKGVCNVSDSEAGACLDIIKVLVPIIDNVLQLACEKKNIVGSLNVVPVIGSIAFATGRLFTWATHVNVQNPVISAIRTEMRLIHDGAMAIANAMVKLAPESYKEEATNTRAHIDAGFKEAIQLYSSG